MITKVQIENNIIVSGLKAKKQVDETIAEAEIRAVDELLEELELPKEDVRKQIKIKTKEYKTNIILLEFSIAHDKYNPNRLFTYINWQRPAARRVSAMMGSSGSIVTKGRSIANVLNEQYKSVFINDSMFVTLPKFIKQTKVILRSLKFSPDEVLKQFERLDKFRICGYDKLSP